MKVRITLLCLCGVLLCGCEPFTPSAPATPPPPAREAAPWESLVTITHDAPGAIAYEPLERRPEGLNIKGEYVMGVSFEFRDQEFIVVASADEQRAHVEMWRWREDLGYQRAAYSNQGYATPCPQASSRHFGVFSIWTTPEQLADAIGPRNRAKQEGAEKKVKERRYELDTELGAGVTPQEKARIDEELTQLTRDLVAAREAARTWAEPVTPFFMLGSGRLCDDPGDKPPLVLIYELKHFEQGSTSGQGFGGKMSADLPDEVKPHVDPISEAIQARFFSGADVRKK